MSNIGTHGSIYKMVICKEPSTHASIENQRSIRSLAGQKCQGVN